MLRVMYIMRVYVNSCGLICTEIIFTVIFTVMCAVI